MHNAFEYEMNTQDSSLIMETSKVLHLFDKAIAEIIDSSYRGEYSKNTESEFNREILKSLYTYSHFTSSTASVEFTNGVEFDLSNENIRYILKDSCSIIFINKNDQTVVKESGLTEATMDTYNILIRDPFSTHRLRLGIASPIRMFTNNKAVLISDGEYNVYNYNITYIKNPTKLTLSTVSWDTEYEELPLKAHKKIVSIAVRMALENEGEERYNTNINEDKQTKS